MHECLENPVHCPLQSSHLHLQLFHVVLQLLQPLAVGLAFRPLGFPVQLAFSF
jgi:hypothetical protein